MTVRKMMWAAAAGLWMAWAAAGTVMGAQAGGPALDSTPGARIKADRLKEEEGGPSTDKSLNSRKKESTAGWVEEGGSLRYKDSKGNDVTNDWKVKDGKSYYLGSDGDIEKDTWIANTYYVDGKGVMVRSKWIHADGTDGLKEEGWYYLGKDGKIEKDGWKNIEDGRYCFDSDGKLRTGWYYEDDNIYYLGDNGAMRTGWQCLEFDEDKLPQEGAVSKEYKKAGQDAKWFYFQTNGRAKRAVSKDYKDATIDGRKYYFDENGVMLTGWHAVKNSPQSGDAVGISRFVYLGGRDDGYVVKSQWKQLSEHPGDSGDKGVLKELSSCKGPQEGDKEWYYFENDGTPAFLKTTTKTMNGSIVKVDGESYFFDQYGRRQNGLIKVSTDGTVLTAYFGETDSDGRMRTGRITGISDGSGDKNTYYFATSGSGKGSGITGEKDGFLYNNGLLVTAKEGTDYQAFKIGGKVYLVNTAGKVQTNEKAYKVDGEYAYRIDGGVLYQADKEGEKGRRVENGAALPAVRCDKEYKL